MGTVTDLRAGRRTPERVAGRLVHCQHCGERHPIIRLADGQLRCVTAFAVDGHWFCRNRGCRAAWIERQR
ncbi:MAG: hypothetical protein U0587_19735 [Candidatus Binatia bacterium]